MLYLNIDNNKVLQISPIQQNGWIAYNGIIPQFDIETQDLVFIDGVVIAQDNTDKIKTKALNFLSQTDAQMIRVIEDLVDILLSKKIIDIKDLPDAVNLKINQRKELREKLK